MFSSLQLRRLNNADAHPGSLFCDFVKQCTPSNTSKLTRVYLKTNKEILLEAMTSLLEVADFCRSHPKVTVTYTIQEFQSEAKTKNLFQTPFKFIINGIASELAVRKKDLRHLILPFVGTTYRSVFNAFNDWIDAAGVERLKTENMRFESPDTELYKGLKRNPKLRRRREEFRTRLSKNYWFVQGAGLGMGYNFAMRSIPTCDFDEANRTMRCTSSESDYFVFHRNKRGLRNDDRYTSRLLPLLNRPNEKCGQMPSIISISPKLTTTATERRPLED
jgi:hypothetical protein